MASFDRSCTTSYWSAIVDVEEYCDLIYVRVIHLANLCIAEINRPGIIFYRCYRSIFIHFYTASC